MRRTEWLMRAALAFCLLYGALAIPNKSHPIFPFFSWDLFSKIPPPRIADFSVRLVESEGMGGLPVYLEESNRFGILLRGQAFKATQIWGTAILKGDRARAAVLRKKFEATYLSQFPQLRYEVVRRVFDLRKRLACSSCFIRETVIAKYTTG